MGDSSIIIIGAILYVTLLVGVSIYASRSVQDSTDFIIAGRRLPLWLCVFTVFATWFGSGTLMGAAGAAYSSGLQGVLANPFGSALCLLLAGLFYVRFLRRMKLLTLPDLFRRRYGAWAEVLCAMCIIPAYIGWVASIFVAFGTVLHTIAGVDLILSVVAGAVITVAYTIAGGMWAVTLTDFVQAIIIIIGLCILFPLVLLDIGGWDALIANTTPGHFDFFPEPTFYGWILFLQGLLVIGFGNIASQDLLQRAFASKNERVAQWSMYLTTILYLTIAMIPVLIGIAGTYLMPDLTDPKFILPEMGKAYLHPVTMAIFVGALFSALMSSADGGMLAPASIFGQNLLKVFKKDLPEEALLKSIRLAVLVVGVLGLMTALYFQDIYQLMVKSFSILMVGLFVPMTAAIYWPKANGPAAIGAITSGVTGWIFLEFYKVQASLPDFPAELIAAGVSLIVLIVITSISHRQVKSLPATDVDGNNIDYKSRVGTLPFPSFLK